MTKCEKQGSPRATVAFPFPALLGSLLEGEAQRKMGKRQTTNEIRLSMKSKALLLPFSLLPLEEGDTQKEKSSQPMTVR